jgi:hypothetical protein
MTIEAIKADLPNFPEEVIDGWLMTHFKRFGWPPKVGNDWRYILRPGNDLSYLQNLKWQKKKIKLTPSLLSPDDLYAVTSLFRSHVLKQTTFFSVMMSDGHERFKSCCAYLKEHGRFPKPVVLEMRPEGLWILDGNHRMTAFLYLYGYFKIEDPSIPCLNVQDEQEVWMATS